MTILDFNTAKPQGTPREKSIDADDIRARLHANPESFVDWLFSGRAICSKSEARIADTSGAAGESLAIKLTGPDAGLWYDHATGDGGGLIDLFMAYQGYDRSRDFQTALKEIARDFLCDPVQLSLPPWQPSVSDRIEEKKRSLGTQPKEQNLLLGAPVESYGYYNREGNVVAVVRRYEPGGTDELGKPNKTFRASPGFPNPRPLYRIPQIIQATHVVLTEGERKADALANVGIEATSAMGGANTKVEMVDWSPLAGKVVTIWPDKDAAGQAYAARVAPILAGLGCTVSVIDPPADVPPKWDAFDCVQAGIVPIDLINAARPYQGAPAVSKPRIRLLDLDEIEDLPPPSWLIDGVLTSNGFSVLWGPPGGLKSFVGVDIGLSVACGLAWHGKPIQAGMVVYVAAEGSYGLAKRAVGWRRTRGNEVAKPRFKLIPQNVALREELEIVIEAIGALSERPVLIVIDTLARTFGSGDENKQADMNAYVTAADRLREVTGAHVMIIHHSGVHEEKRERGSNVLRGAADTVIKVARKGDALQLINRAPEGKQKDAEEFETVRLRTAKIAYLDKSGTEHKTLILTLDETEEEPERETQKLRKQQPSPLQDAILTAFEKASPEPLGVTRLALMTGKSHDGNKSLYRSLEKLEQQNLIERADEEGSKSRLWRLT